jgi:hypothetical protein
MGMPVQHAIEQDARLEVRKSLPEDVIYMAPRLRIADMAEIAAASGEPPTIALGRGFANSVPCYTALWDGRPAAMFGVVPVKMDGFPRVGGIWMLGTDDIPLFSKSFMRWTKPWLATISEGYDMVMNQVDARNGRHITWLKRCGFKFMQTGAVGPHNLPFHEFVKIV